VKEGTCFVEKINPLDGFSNAKARKTAFRIAKQGMSRTFYADSYWQGPDEVFTAMRKAGLDWELKSAEYSEDGSHKKWSFFVTFSNANNKKTVLNGTLIAHGAGTMDDPLGRYDMTVQIY
jgi:hypothetical protein